MPMFGPVALEIVCDIFTNEDVQTCGLETRELLGKTLTS